MITFLIYVALWTIFWYLVIEAIEKKYKKVRFEYNMNKLRAEYELPTKSIWRN